MNSSGRTMFVVQDGPANALAHNKDYSQVVVAGRNVFKVYAIDEDCFTERYNLRVGKNLNLNFSCNDVVWSTLEEHLLATAATNGAVVVWNLNRPSRTKQEHVFFDHKRTVNKVSFHTTEAHLLISGSQDGTVKCFDLRSKESKLTFHSNSESVRDVQVNPHQPYTFASVSENGSVQLWDLRRADKVERQFTAHSGPVFACDWHPEIGWLATAGRDKTIKVWELSSGSGVKACLEHTIHTIASVGRIRWRPHRRFHIASCALVVDSSVCVWDVRRPYVPFAAFYQHRDVATGIAWRGQPHLFLTTSKDCTLYQHAFRDAARPASRANPQGLGVAGRGDVCFATRAGVGGQVVPAGKQHHGIFRKTPNLSDLFCIASSTFHVFQPNASSSEVSLADQVALSWVPKLARGYLLGGRPFAEICEHNAAVARAAHREQVAYTWQMLRIMYSGNLEDLQSSPPPGAGGGGLGGMAREDAVQDGKGGGGGLDKGDTWPPGSRHQSGSGDRGAVGVLRVKAGAFALTEVSAVAASLLAAANVTGGGEGAGVTVPVGPGAPPMYSGGEEETETDEQEHQGHHQQIKSIARFPIAHLYSQLSESLTFTHVQHLQNQQERSLATIASGLAEAQSQLFFGEGAVAGELETVGTFDYETLAALEEPEPPDWTLPSEAFQPRHEILDHSPPPEQFPHRCSPHLTETSDTQTVTVEDQTAALLCVTSALHLELWNPTPVVWEMLQDHACRGDVQTSVSALLVLGEERLPSKDMDEAAREHWFLSYIDLLHHFRLWDIATEVIRSCPLPSVHQLNQQSTTVHTGCGQCGKSLSRCMWRCDNCRSISGQCSLCHVPVRGLFAWCQGCGHGGHMAHMHLWFTRNRHCPTGCGHLCDYT